MDLARRMEGQRPTVTRTCLSANDLMAEALKDEIEEGCHVLMGRNDHIGAVKGLHQSASRNRPTAVRAPEEGAPSEFRYHRLPLARPCAAIPILRVFDPHPRFLQGVTP